MELNPASTSDPAGALGDRAPVCKGEAVNGWNNGLAVTGYEIHLGRTVWDLSVSPVNQLTFGGSCLPGRHGVGHAFTDFRHRCVYAPVNQCCAREKGCRNGRSISGAKDGT
jgi:hypothetical protein